MQDKLKKAYETVESIPIDSEAFPCFVTEDANIKANFDRLEKLLNEEKSNNTSLLQAVYLKFTINFSLGIYGTYI